MSHIYQPGAGVALPAILQVAEPDRSDLGLIGMMVRCSEGAGDMVPVLVIAEPLPPRAEPQVTLRVSGVDLALSGQVIPTGAGISLPIDIREKILGPWRQSSELSVTIKNGVATVNGVIRLAGLFEGLTQLAAECGRN